MGIIGCIINAVLDYLFVDKLNMGEEGSAVASLIVQAITVIVQSEENMQYIILTVSSNFCLWYIKSILQVAFKNGKST